MKFFKPSGEEINKEEFISLYNDIYFMNNNVNAEKSIEYILRRKNETLDKNDIKKILAWKLGKIKRKQTLSNVDEFPYNSNPEDPEFWKIRNGKIIDIESLFNYLKQNPLDDEADIKLYINNLVKNNYGIGYVYAITLLYFVSKGKYPIYDRFAMIAIKAIEEEKMPGEIISYSELSENFMSEKNKCSYKTYTNLIEDHFNDEFKKDIKNRTRFVDRALWTYGHLFVEK